MPIDFQYLNDERVRFDETSQIDKARVAINALTAFGLFRPLEDRLRNAMAMARSNESEAIKNELEQ